MACASAWGVNGLGGVSVPDDKNRLPLAPAKKSAMLTDEQHVIVSRADLEKEHSLLIARLHLIRKQLGYAPLTHKEQRRQAK